MKQTYSPSASAYNGYEYQIVASIWVALTLMIKEQVATAVVVEPDSLEDLEALVSGQKIEPDKISATVTVPLDGDAHILYQMKTCSFKAWTAGALRDVIGNGEPAPKLGPGPSQRAKALQLLLEDEAKLYTLITDAAVSSELSSIARAAFPVKRDAVPLPDKILSESTQVNAEVLCGRVHIIKGHSETLLRHLIDELLTQSARVPYTNAKRCFEELIQCFRLCLLRRRDSRIAVSELRGIFARFGAIDPTGPIPGYVAPTVFPIASTKLRNQRCLVLLGPPDIGKASLADYLAVNFELHELNCPVNVLNSFAQLSMQLSDPGPALLVLKNGWDGENFSLHRTPADLPSILDRAPADKYIIVTCDRNLFLRLPLYMQSRLERYTVSIGPDDYSEDDRWQIVLNQARLDGWQLVSLNLARGDVLRVARDPLTLNLLGNLIQDRAHEMTEPSPAEDDWLFDTSDQSCDRNGEFFDSLVKIAMRQTIGDRTKRVLESYSANPLLHAALYVSLGYVNRGYAAPRKSDEARFATLIVDKVFAKTGVLLDYTSYVEYLVLNEVLQSHEAGAKIWIEATQRDAMRSLINSAVRAAHPVLISIIEELEDELNPRNFADQLLLIGSFISFGYRDGPYDKTDWWDVRGRIDSKILQAFQDHKRDAFVENVEAIMCWRWGNSDLVNLLGALSPDGIPHVTVDDSGFLVPEIIWQGPLGKIRLELPHNFLRNFLLSFMPYTTIDYNDVKAYLISFFLDSREINCSDIQNSLHALEAHATTDYGDGRWEYEDGWKNQQVLLALLRAAGCNEFESRLPRAKDEWEL